MLVSYLSFVLSVTVLSLSQLNLAEKNPGPPGDKFVQVMKPFLGEAEKEAASLKTRCVCACVGVGVGVWVGAV